MQGYIFDFDGVIINSELAWPVHENNAYKKLLPHWQDEHHPEVMGKNMTDTHDILSKKYQLEMSRDDFIAMWDRLAPDVYLDSTLMPGIVDFLRKLTAIGKTLAIATSSHYAWINPVLDQYELRDYFSAIVTSDDIPVGQGKPQPTVYLKAAELIGLTPDDCIGLEDSPHGIAAVKAADMYCIAIRSDSNRKKDLSQADEIVTSFNEITVEDRS